MNKRFKRVSLAIYLDPLQSIPDSFAYNTFIGWSKKSKELAADSTAAMELHQLVHIHKDIYMSGMFLHCLKPELATSFAMALSNDAITEQSLLDILKVHQIQPQAVQGRVEEKEILPESKVFDVDSVIDNVSSKIEHLLELKLSEHLSQRDFSANMTPPVSDFTHITEYMSSQLSQHQQSLVEHITAHADTQCESKIDAQALSHDIAKAIGDKLDHSQKITELKSVVTQQNTLISQLIQQIKQQSEGVAVPANIAEPQESVEEGLEKVQRLKKKGVF